MYSLSHSSSFECDIQMIHSHVRAFIGNNVRAVHVIREYITLRAVL